MFLIPVLPDLGARRTFKKCAWRWLQEYRYGYKPRGIQADALWFGIGIHQALAEWYLKGKRRGPHPAVTFSDWCGEEIAFAKSYLTETFEEPVWLDARDLGIAMLEGYVEQWGKDSRWQIISTEQPFEIAIRQGKTAVIFKSRWDGVFRDLATGRILLLETKTASQVATAYLELDDQGGSYWAVAGRVLRVNGVLKKGEEIDGIQYNFLRKAMPDERERDAQGLYLNQNGSVSKKQPPPLSVRPEPIMRNAGEIATAAPRIADEVAWMNAIRSGILPVTKTPTRDCPRCPFWGPCTLHEQGSDAYQTLLRSALRS